MAFRANYPRRWRADSLTQIKGQRGPDHGAQIQTIDSERLILRNVAATRSVLKENHTTVELDMTEHDEPGTPKSGVTPLCVSRRQVLQGAAVGAGGAALVLAATVPAQAKMTQAAAGYQDSPAKNGDACATCSLFKAPAACTLVDGTISPKGWCRFYNKKS